MIMKGQKISDRYQIIKSIGEGGMANVYLAYDTILDRNVAVKVLRGDLATDEKFVRRFQREALSASSLSHPNIVEVYDVGEDNGQYYIVMEYIEGKHLKSLLKKRGKLTVSEVIDIMLQITDGMACAHDSYIIHRDIKPQNIMILDNGTVKITDFGIAMAMNATQLTQTNSVMGSVHYLPPEQANGKGSTLQSDIYSMGIVMYELLTGKLPYKGDNAVEIALKHLKEPLPSIKDELPTLPQSIENIILKATAKNPKNRYNDAREMHEDLLTCLDDARKEEPRLTYLYPEMEAEDGKTVKAPKKEEIEKKEEGEEPIAKQIIDAEKKSENKILLTLAGVFTGLIVLITSLVLLLPVITNRKEVKVPDVTNMELSQAVDTLQEAGFKVSDDIRETWDENVTEGNVAKTYPIAGTKRTKGTEVTIYISVDSTIPIEDLTGKNYMTEQGRLEEKGLYVLIEKKDIPEDDEKEYKEYEIIDQSVKAGEKLTAGDTITLYIPNIVSEYPDFTNGEYTVEDVRTFAEEYKLGFDPQYVETSDYEENTIFYQNYKPGYTILPGTHKLIIKIAVAPSNQDVTDVVPGLE